MFNLFQKKSPNYEKPVVEKPAQDFKDTQPIADYFQQQTGISFEKQTAILKSKLVSFCTLREINSFQECLNLVQKDPESRQQLINYLTTNETYFYREFRQIEKLVTQVAEASAKVDILCLPCSTGEEPYTIVIALLEAGIDPNKFNLVGADINTAALDRARSGVYNERNVSKMPRQLVDKYFHLSNEKYLLDNKVKSMVYFTTLNLFDESIGRIGKFDFILSRNMLIYFDKPTKQQAGDILHSLLKDKNTPIFYGHADLY